MNGNSSYGDSGGNSAQCGHDFPGDSQACPGRRAAGPGDAPPQSAMMRLRLTLPEGWRDLSRPGLFGLIDGLNGMVGLVIGLTRAGAAASLIFVALLARAGSSAVSIGQAPDTRPAKPGFPAGCAGAGSRRWAAGT